MNQIPKEKRKSIRLGALTLTVGEQPRSLYQATLVCGEGAQLTVGAVSAAKLTAELQGTEDCTNQTASLSAQVQLEDSSITLPLGSFVVTECKAGEERSTITAYDAAYCAMGKTYAPSIANPPATALAVLEEVGQQCGLVLADTTGLTDQPVSGNLSGYTCRDMAGYMAALLGCNALIDREGRLALRWFASGDSITPDDYYSGGLKLEGEQTLTGVRMRKKVTVTTTISDGITTEEEQTAVFSAGTGTGLVIEVENPFATQAIADAVWEKIGGLGTFRTGSCAYFGGLATEPGDLLTVTDLNGVSGVLPVMGLTLELDGGCKATATAAGQSETVLSAGTRGQVGRLLSKLQADIAQFKELTADNFAATVAKVDSLYADEGWVKNLFAQQIQAKEVVVGEVNPSFSRPEAIEVTIKGSDQICMMPTMVPGGRPAPDSRMSLMGVGVEVRKTDYSGYLTNQSYDITLKTPIGFRTVTVSGVKPQFGGNEIYTAVDGEEIHADADVDIYVTVPGETVNASAVGYHYLIFVTLYFGYRGDMTSKGNFTAEGSLYANKQIYEGGTPLSEKYAPISAFQHAKKVYSSVRFSVDGNTACTVVFDVSANRAQLPSNAVMSIECVNAQNSNVVVTNYWWNDGESKAYAVYRNLTGSTVTTTAQLAMLTLY